MQFAQSNQTKYSCWFIESQIFHAVGLIIFRYWFFSGHFIFSEFFFHIQFHLWLSISFRIHIYFKLVVTFVSSDSINSILCYRCIKRLLAKFWAAKLSTLNLQNQMRWKWLLGLVFQLSDNHWLLKFPLLSNCDDRAIHWLITG